MRLPVESGLVVRLLQVIWDTIVVVPDKEEVSGFGNSLDGRW